MNQLGQPESLILGEPGQSPITNGGIFMKIDSKGNPSIKLINETGVTIWQTP